MYVKVIPIQKSRDRSCLIFKLKGYSKNLVKIG